MKKVYKGFETLERMKTHWVTTYGSINKWKIIDGKVMCMVPEYEIEHQTGCSIDFFLENEFIDHEEPIKVDDWVHIIEDERDRYIAKVEQVTGDVLVVDETIYINNNHRHVSVSKARKATAEEIAQEKRRRVFAKVGREVDEFKEGDYVEYLGERFQLKFDDLCHEVVLKGALTIVMSESFDKGQLKPIYFVDNMVREDD